MIRNKKAKTSISGMNKSTTEMLWRAALGMQPVHSERMLPGNFLPWKPTEN
jgi:hypothetical protein